MVSGRSDRCPFRYHCPALRVALRRGSVTRSRKAVRSLPVGSPGTTRLDQDLFRGLPAAVTRTGTIRIVAPAEIIRAARQRAALSLPALAERVGIPSSEVEAYEAGRKIPDAETLDWIVSCATFDRGEELAALLDLTEQFPVRHCSTLEYPVFGR